MKLISNRKGGYHQAIEEFENPIRGSKEYIVVKGSNYYWLQNEFWYGLKDDEDLCDIEGLTKYISYNKSINWRSESHKNKVLDHCNLVLSKLVSYKRDENIKEVLGENYKLEETMYLAC